MNESFESVIIKILKFGITGLSGLVIDFGVTWILKEKIRINKYIANAAGFSLAVTNNYIINRRWTFHSEKNLVHTFTLFLVFSLCGLLINHLLLTFLHSRKNVPFYTAKIIATICVFFWNFTTNFFFTF